PAAASAAVHFSELGTTLVSGISHHKFGNVDWRTVGILAGPGFIGALIGSTVLANLNGEAATPWVSGILLALRVYVLWRFRGLGGPGFPGGAVRLARPGNPQRGAGHAWGAGLPARPGRLFLLPLPPSGRRRADLPAPSGPRVPLAGGVGRRGAGCHRRGGWGP